MGFIRDLIVGFIADVKNVCSLGDMSTEGRFLTSIGVSLGVFVLFIAITGDLYSGLGFTILLELFLLFVFNVSG